MNCSIEKKPVELIDHAQFGDSTAIDQEKKITPIYLDGMQPQEVTDSLLTSYRPSRPVLPSLSHPIAPANSRQKLHSFQENLSRFIDSVEEIKSREITHFDQLISEISERMIANKSQEMNHCQQNEQITKQTESWTFLKHLATALASSATIVMGATILANGGDWALGAAVIGSGIFSLIGIGMAHTSNHPNIAGAFALCSAALGLATGNFGALPSEKIIPWILYGVFSITAGATHVGSKYSEYQKTLLEKELKKIQGKLNIEQQQLDDFSGAVKKTSELLSTQEISSLVKNYKSSMQRIISADLQA